MKKIRQAFRNRTIYPILGHAHHTHMRFLTSQELTQEIVRNRDALRSVFGVEPASPVGYFPSECSIENMGIQAIRGACVDFIIFPNIENQERLVEVRDGSIEDITFKPFYATCGEDRILALPRNFTISQQMWRGAGSGI